MLINLVLRLIASHYLLLLGILAFMLILGVACGGGSTATPAPTSTPTPTSPPAATPVPETPTPTSAPTPTPLPQERPSPTATPPLIPTPTATSVPSPTTTPTATPMPTPAPTPTPSVFPLVITDSNGKEVTFKEPPKSIIAYDSAVVEFLFAMGEGDRIVGTHDFLSYPPEALEIPRVGSAFAVNAEKILELNPDLISVFFASAVDQVENLGVKVLYIDSPSTLAGIPEQMRMWGRITGNTVVPEKIVEDFESRLKEVVDRLASLEQGPRLFHDDSLFFTSGPNTILGQVYILLKAQNIAHDISGYGQLSPEVIVERDPEVIITTFAGMPQEYMDNPAFQGVSAVKNGRVYLIRPDGIVSVFGTRFVVGIENLAKLIHPDLFE